jgi:hypothetical protein
MTHSTYSDAEDGGNMYGRNIDNNAHVHTMKRRMNGLPMNTEPQNRLERGQPGVLRGYLIPPRQELAQ